MLSAVLAERSTSNRPGPDRLAVGMVVLAVLLPVLVSLVLVREALTVAVVGWVPVGAVVVRVRSGSSPPGPTGPGWVQARLEVHVQPLPAAVASGNGAYSCTVTGPLEAAVPALTTPADAVPPGPAVSGPGPASVTARSTGTPPTAVPETAAPSLPLLASLLFFTLADVLTL